MCRLQTTVPAHSRPPLTHARSVKQPLRRVPLLLRHGLIRRQPAPDYWNERIGLRARDPGCAPLTWRNRNDIIFRTESRDTLSKRLVLLKDVIRQAHSDDLVRPRIKALPCVFLHDRLDLRALYATSVTSPCFLLACPGSAGVFRCPRVPHIAPRATGPGAECLTPHPGPPAGRSASAGSCAADATPGTTPQDRLN